MDFREAPQQKNLDLEMYPVRSLWIMLDVLAEKKVSRTVPIQQAMTVGLQKELELFVLKLLMIFRIILIYTEPTFLVFMDIENNVFYFSPQGSEIK